VHGGWSREKALLYNFLSAATFLLGGLVTYALSSTVDVTYLIPFAAGNFVYIAAATVRGSTSI
jgi:zinc and cadmium transporter